MQPRGLLRAHLRVADGPRGVRGCAADCRRARQPAATLPGRSLESAVPVPPNRSVYLLMDQAQCPALPFGAPVGEVPLARRPQYRARPRPCYDSRAHTGTHGQCEVAPTRQHPAMQLKAASCSLRGRGGLLVSLGHTARGGNVDSFNSIAHIRSEVVSSEMLTHVFLTRRPNGVRSTRRCVERATTATRASWSCCWRRVRTRTWRRTAVARRSWAWRVPSTSFYMPGECQADRALQCRRCQRPRS